MKSLARLPATTGLLLLLSTALSPAGATGVEGLWCGTGLLHEFSLDLTQSSPEEVTGTLARKQRKRELHGRLEGNVLRTQSTKVGSLVLELDGGNLRIIGGDGPLALAKGLAFIRASGAACERGS
ncbi:hypothetical protein GCM10027034_22910 [Ramlibacter solisilvae]|uniref:Uncharacterized protein n=1 Tax=Ramlibacter tataouinensis TaxID=94132 RepID=A0A127JPV1_9BURK|nr:hypothetical protein [Ramlibacter tataouinensis]AMO22010.1 hypothetical protein UC35_02875 [Ramlibacter tataouinensis]